MQRTRHNVRPAGARRATAGALTALAIALTGCGGDRITLHFADAATRAEAVAVDAFAVRRETRSGGHIDCPALLEQPGRIDDDDLVIEHTTVPLPAPRNQVPLLNQLPQSQYAFYAVAHDGFAFTVARGCQTGEISGNRSLDLELTLVTVPAPDGTLEPVAATQWVQHAGLSGAELAPWLAVRARDSRGQPLSGLEVRARVIAGSAALTASVLQTLAGVDPAEAGVASTTMVVEPGQTEVQLHARGLAGSPITFTIDGIANPNYRDQSVVTPRDPVALVGGEFVFDPSPSKPLPDDLIAVLSVGTATSATFWRGGEDGGWEGELRDRGLQDSITAVATGFFDNDARPDLAVVAGATPQFGIYPHDDWLDDAFRNFSEIDLPAGVVAVDRMLVLHAEPDPFSDVVLSARTAGGRLLLLYLSLGTAPGGGPTEMSLEQQIVLPSWVGDPDLFAGDPDGDGDDDLLLLKPFDVSMLVPCGDDRAGLGSGRYFAPAPIATDTWPRLAITRGTRFIAFADLDEDGWPDGLALRDGAVGESARLQLAHGDGTLEPVFSEVDNVLGMSTIQRALVEDFNGDRHRDLLLVTAESPLRATLLGGDGSGRFAAPLPLDVGFTPVDVAAADINRDGIYDIGLLGARCEGGSHLLVKTSSRVAR